MGRKRKYKDDDSHKHTEARNYKLKTILLKDTQISVNENCEIGPGGRIWDGAIALAFYIYKNERFMNRCIKCIELGAGCGLPSLIMAMTSGSGVVHVSDRPQYINLINSNIELFQNHNQYNANVALLSKTLQWGNRISGDSVYDVILGSELVGVGNAEICEALVHTLSILFDQSINAGGIPIALFSYRNRAEYESVFFDLLTQHGMQYKTVVSFSSGELMNKTSDFYCKDRSIDIYEITKEIEST